MKLNELIDVISAETGIEPDQVQQVMDSFRDNVIDTVAGGGKVVIPNLGTFRCGSLNARNIYNLSTGNIQPVPPTSIPKFSASDHFRKAIPANAAHQTISA